jgi:hypothetical protein
MFERTRFVRYAMKFERAFRSDDWTAVRRCFHDDAIYTIEGAPGFDSDNRGPDTIVALFKHMLDQVDRRFDRRIPRPAGWMRVRDGELVVPWRARYVAGADSVTLDGTSHCRFDGAKIAFLRDTMIPEQVAAWLALCERHTGGRVERWS